MEFRDNQAIYLQIVEYIGEQILLKKWLPGEKIASIRELAITMQVTPNTVQRAYDFLQQREIIANKRGIGYFVAEESKKKFLAFRKEQFIERELPVFFRNIYILNMDMEEIEGLYRQFIQSNFKNH